MQGEYHKTYDDEFENEDYKVKPKYIKEDPEIVAIKRRRKALSKMLDETSLDELLRLAIDIAMEKSTSLQKIAKELMSEADTYSRRINGSVVMKEIEEVSREEFTLFIQKHKHLDGKPVVESDTVCAMQYIERGNVIAQAEYWKGGTVIYKVVKDYDSVNKYDS